MCYGLLVIKESGRPLTQTGTETQMSITLSLCQRRVGSLTRTGSKSPIQLGALLIPVLIFALEPSAALAKCRDRPKPGVD